MPKTITSALNTHLGLETTSLTTLWRIIRTDGTEFFFTDHDISLTFEGNLYEAAVGYDRTAVANQVGLSVDNLDVTGFLDSSALTDAELRAGLFDFAEVRISLVNFSSLSDGTLKMRRGKLGEIIYSDGGTFETELRGLTQAYSQQIVELYEPECRADLGDSRCKIELFPDVLLRNTAYILGDIVRASELMANIPESALLVPGDTNANDISTNVAVGTLGSQSAQQTSVSTIGAGAIEHTPTGSVNPALSFLSFPDIAAYAIGASIPFTIEGHFRWKSITLPSNVQTIASQYLNTGNQRGWFLRWNGTGPFIDFVTSNDGIATDVNYQTANFTPTVGTWYHIAVTRDSSNNIRLFINGVQSGSTVVSSNVIFNSTEVIRLGKLRSTGFDDQPHNGFVDDFRFVVGVAAYTGSFTPPSVAHISGPASLISTLTTPDFDDRIFTATVAGITGVTQPSLSITPSATTVDGGVTWQAGESFTKAGTISAVVDNRTFSATFSQGVDSREVSDWFKYGAIGWETGNNAFTGGLNMEVKANTPAITTGVTTFAVDDTNTFSRSTGSFVTDGFQVGMNITTSGFTAGANNGSFAVQAVAALTLDIVETTLVAESGTGNELIISDEFISLFLSMPFVIQVGDTFNLYAGCDKRLSTCKTKFSNIVNFRGEPFVPGQDAFIAVQTQR